MQSSSPHAGNAWWLWLFFKHNPRVGRSSRKPTRGSEVLARIPVCSWRGNYALGNVAKIVQAIPRRDRTLYSGYWRAASCLPVPIFLRRRSKDSTGPLPGDRHVRCNDDEAGAALKRPTIAHFRTDSILLSVSARKWGGTELHYITPQSCYSM